MEIRVYNRKFKLEVGVAGEGTLGSAEEFSQLNTDMNRKSRHMGETFTVERQFPLDRWLNANKFTLLREAATRDQELRSRMVNSSPGLSAKGMKAGLYS